MSTTTKAQTSTPPAPDEQVVRDEVQNESMERWRRDDDETPLSGPKVAKLSYWRGAFVGTQDF